MSEQAKKTLRSEIRVLNGYRLVYEPDHHRAMHNSSYDGFIYEHIEVAERFLGRPLRDDEVVHHLDGNKSNNRRENLLVLPGSQHAKLHAWLAAGAPTVETVDENRVNSVKVKATQPTYCVACERTLQNMQTTFCSIECANSVRRKAVRPLRQTLANEIKQMSWRALGRKYGVSDNAVRKWARQYGLLSPTLSQAGGTPPEGAETSGEVQPS